MHEMHERISHLSSNVANMTKNRFKTLELREKNQPNKYEIAKIFKIAMLVYKFINKIKESIKPSKITKINESFLRLINDLAGFEFENQLTQKQQSKPFMFLSSLKYYYILTKNRFPIKILPSHFLKKWDFFNIITTLIILMIFSFDFSFYDEYSLRIKQSKYFLNMIFLPCFLFDLFIRVNQHEILKEKQEFLKSNNFAQNIFIDILGLIPLFANLVSPELFRYLNIFFFVKIIRVFNYLLDYQQRMMKNYYEKLSHILLNSFISNFFLCHFMSCVWYHISNLQRDSEHLTWIKINKLDELPIILKYFYSYTFIFEIFTFHKNSLIGPQNLLETTVIFSIRILSILLIFDLIFRLVCLIVSVNEKEDEHFNENIFFQNHNLNESLKAEIKRFLQNNNSKKQKNKHEEIQTNFLTNLPFELKNDIIFQMNKRSFNKIHLLKMNFSKQTLKKVKLLLEESHFLAFQKIFEKDSNDNSLYFIKSGIISFSFSNERKNKTQINLKKENESFGEYEFITGFSRNLTAFSLTKTILLRLDREKFIEILRKNQANSDLFRFCYMKDQIVFQKNYESLKIQCQSCNNSSHDEFLCPYVHYVPKLTKYMRQIENNLLIIKKRVIFQRKKKKFKVFQKKIHNIGTETEYSSDDETFNDTRYKIESFDKISSFFIDEIVLGDLNHYSDHWKISEM